MRPLKQLKKVYFMWAAGFWARYRAWVACAKERCGKRKAIAKTGGRRVTKHSREGKEGAYIAVAAADAKRRNATHACRRGKRAWRWREETRTLPGRDWFVHRLSRNGVPAGPQSIFLGVCLSLGKKSGRAALFPGAIPKLAST